MKTKLICLMCLVAAAAGLGTAGASVPAQRPRPDPVIRQFQFPPTNDKGLRVQVANYGTADAGNTVLRLTVRRIKGASVGRTMEVPVPAVAKGGVEWVTLNAGGILPNDVSLKDTTFKLNADATSLVSESKENNNEKWHNLN